MLISIVTYNTVIYKNNVIYFLNQSKDQFNNVYKYLHLLYIYIYIEKTNKWAGSVRGRIGSGRNDSDSYRTVGVYWSDSKNTSFKVKTIHEKIT